MTLIQTIIAFIIALSLLIVVHEYGHYWAARACGVKVLRFSVGMGRILISRRFGKDQTEWVISMLPLGGYVKLLDARAEDVGALSPEDQKREFTSQPVWKRFIIVAAGSCANFALAIALLTGLYMHGVPEPVARLDEVESRTLAAQSGLQKGDLVLMAGNQASPSWPELRWHVADAIIAKKPLPLRVERKTFSKKESVTQVDTVLHVEHMSRVDLDKDFMSATGLILAKPPAVIDEVFIESPALEAGLKRGDQVLKVDGAIVNHGERFLQIIRESPEKMLVVEVLRGSERQTYHLKPEAVQEEQGRIGRIGAKVLLMPEMRVVQDNMGAAFLKGIDRTWDTTLLSFKVIGKMITGEVSLKSITGPIAIADYAGQSARAGWIRYLYFIVFISISVGVMNLLPIPVLDGGLLLYYAVEMIIRRPVPDRVANIAYRFGIGFLILLMVVATFNDLNRLIK